MGNLESDPKPTMDMKQGIVGDPFDEQYSAQKKKPSIFYFALRIFSKNKDFTIKIDDKHADLLMEKKIKSFIDSC